MSKKSPKKKLSVLQKFALFSLALLILIVGGTYLYVSELDYHSVNNFFDSLLVDKSIKEKPVKDMISYTLPLGWTENIETETGIVFLKSTDYKEPTTLNTPDGNGVVIALDVSPKYRFETLRSEKRYWSKHSLASDISDISIDGVSGFKYIISAERLYSLQYFFIKDKYTINITVENYNRRDIDERYWDDINSVINSIQFK